MVAINANEPNAIIRTDEIDFAAKVKVQPPATASQFSASVVREHDLGNKRRFGSGLSRWHDPPLDCQPWAFSSKGFGSRYDCQAYHHAAE
jgi:hypothetical protein